TTLANLVGRSVVSAMTHTPASGPFGLVTTPPRSATPIETVGVAGCWASTTTAAPARYAAMAITATSERLLPLVFIKVSFRIAAEGRSHPPADTNSKIHFSRWSKGIIE